MRVRIRVGVESNTEKDKTKTGQAVNKTRVRVRVHSSCKGVLHLGCERISSEEHTPNFVILNIYAGGGHYPSNLRSHEVQGSFCHYAFLESFSI
jgi:hypothetical protein